MYSPSLNIINRFFVPPFGLDVGLGVKKTGSFQKLQSNLHMFEKAIPPEGQSSCSGEPMPKFLKHKIQGKYL